MYCTGMDTHTKYHICISQQQKEDMTFRVSHLSGPPGAECIFEDVFRSEICVKQLSTQSRPSENDSNKGMVMAEFPGFNQFFVFE